MKDMVRLAVFAVMFLLASCASPPPLSADPDTAAFLAGGTMTAVYDVQQATRAEYERQVVAAENATAQAANATMQAAYVTQAAATATAMTREAATAAAVTATAQASATHGAVRDQLTADASERVTRQASAVETATATALVGATERDRAAQTRGSVLGWLGLGALAGLLYVVLRLLYAAAAPRLWEARIIRNTRTGEPVALWVGRGMWELIEPEPIPALPAPNGNGEPDRVIPVNGNREPLLQYSDDVRLDGPNGEAVIFTQRQVRLLRRWYEQGYTSIRRDTRDGVGPGFDQLGMGSGDTYQKAYRLLQRYGYIDGNDWTPLGVAEFLGGSPSGGPVQDRSPSNGRQTGAY